MIVLENQDFFVNLAKNFLFRPDLIATALGATKSRRSVYDKEFSVDNLGISVGVKFRNPDNPSQGGKADIEIKDFSKLIPYNNIGLVKLGVTFRSYGLMVEYEFHHPYDEQGTIGLIISENENNKTISLKSTIQAAKHDEKRFIIPFEIQLNLTGSTEVEGILTYSHHHGVEYPIHIRKDDDTIHLLMETQRRSTLFNFRFDWKKPDLQIYLDFDDLGYMFFIDLSIENNQEEVEACLLLKIFEGKTSFKIEIDKMLKSICLKIAPFNQSERTYKYKFRKIPDLMLKEYETNAYEVLVDSGFLLDPPISMRLGLKSRNLQRLRKRNEIEVKICLALFPNHFRKSKYTTIIIQRDRFTTEYDHGQDFSESLHAFAEYEGIQLFETHSEILVLNKMRCNTDACELECNFSGSLHRNIFEDLELMGLFRYIPCSQVSLKTRVNILNLQMKALAFEIQTSRVERDYRMIKLEWENKQEKVKLKSVLMISPERTHTLDLSVSSSLDKMELAYKGWHREVVVDWREKPIRNNGIASYEFRLFYDDVLMGAGILNIKDQHMEVFYTGQHGRFSYLDIQFLIFSNRINNSSVNINIEGSTKPVMEESRCSFLIWNTTYTFNQNYGDPVLLIDSKQLLDTRIFEAKCQDQPMYNSSSLGLSLLGHGKQPFQMSLNMELKSELYPSGQLNVSTSLSPWNIRMIHSENYTKDKYIKRIEESSTVDNYLSIVTNYTLKSDSFQNATYAEIVIAPSNGTFKIQLKEKKFEIILNPEPGKYLSISTNIKQIPFTHYPFESFKIDADGEWRNIVHDDVRIARYKLKREDLGMNDLLDDNEISVVLAWLLVHIEWNYTSNYKLKDLKIKGYPGWYLHTPSHELDKQAILDNPLFTIKSPN